MLPRISPLHTSRRKQLHFLGSSADTCRSTHREGYSRRCAYSSFVETDLMLQHLRVLSSQRHAPMDALPHQQRICMAAFWYRVVPRPAAACRPSSTV